MEDNKLIKKIQPQSMDAHDKKTVREYLLGYLPEERSTTIDERLFVSEHFLAMIEQVEDEIIDEYLEESLSAADKLAVEEHFLQPAERRDKLRFAGMLRSQIQQNPPRSSD
ncbi:MAG: hypothetical protein JWQ87_5270 [Candidatus Sulfotelmatobacter sp.]|nr:hypothetical protein [Candidatus Sulfotelmatobacter sp.]